MGKADMPKGYSPRGADGAWVSLVNTWFLWARGKRRAGRGRLVDATPAQTGRQHAEMQRLTARRPHLLDSNPVEEE